MDETQIVYVVVTEPTNPGFPSPFALDWGRSEIEAARTLEKTIADATPGTTVYHAALPVPIGGDFATDESMEAALKRIVWAWPRNEIPPAEQALGAGIVFVPEDN